MRVLATLTSPEGRIVRAVIIKKGFPIGPKLSRR
jgi:hypothetical protein